MRAAWCSPTSTTSSFAARPRSRRRTIRRRRTKRWRREIRPDPVLLFRYSAVTFNSHRIHYDHPYATGVEGYPGLVVHGPLIATLLVDLLRRNRPDTILRQYRFRALKPLYDTASFHTCGLPDEGSTQLPGCGPG